MIQRDARPKRALLGLVVNAHGGNAEALTGKRRGLTALSNCGVAGCRCEHFAVADGAPFGVCHACQHGAMYHATARDCAAVVSGGRRGAGNGTALSIGPSVAPAGAATLVTPSPDDTVGDATDRVHAGVVPRASAAIGRTAPNAAASAAMTTATASAADAQQVTRRPEPHASSLASVLAEVDHLERGAVLRTFRCDEDSAAASAASAATTAAGNVTGVALSRSACCALLSQALSLLVRATDLVDVRIGRLRRDSAVVGGAGDGAAAAATSAAASERQILQRRLEQLMQHADKVRLMLRANESRYGGGGGGGGDADDAGADGDFRGAMLAADMMAGPRGFDGGLGIESVGRVSASRASSVGTRAASVSLARDLLQEGVAAAGCDFSAGDVAAAPDDARAQVRLCTDCLETTPSVAHFCHNCGVSRH